jgi:fatty acid desaturase
VNASTMRGGPVRRPTRTSWLASLLNDPRDRPFVMLSIWATVVVLPCAAAFYVPGVFRWWLGPAYIAMLGVFFCDRFILMLHNTSHRPLFKPQVAWLNAYIPWVLGPFFGETPETYFAFHVGMHHLEGNLFEDVSTTMPYRRDSIVDFLRYFFKFISRGLADLAAYLTRKKRFKLRRRMLKGEMLYFALVAVLMFVNWRATTVVFIWPLLIVRFLMMAGNWGQHAFIDPRAPEDSYLNSITCLARRYNRRCFNDGYHIGHHLDANLHWTEMPADFERNRDAYGRAGSIVFKDVDYFQIWFLLMFHAYKQLAHHYVTLTAPPRSEADIIALLRERTRAFPVPA